MSEVLTKPELVVTNLWCPNCGRQKFEPRYTILICLHCGTSLEWSDTWKMWYSSSSPGDFGGWNEHPAGTEWKKGSTGWWNMVPQYDPNTGKKLTDPKVRKALLKVKSCLEKKLTKVDHQLELVK